MNRIKTVAVSTITAAMILGSTIVIASEPAPETTGTSADAPSISTVQPDPSVRRGGGGGGGFLKN